MTDPVTASVTPQDVRQTASVCRHALQPVADMNWDSPASDLQWSCRTTWDMCWPRSPTTPSISRFGRPSRGRPGRPTHRCRSPSCWTRWRDGPRSLRRCARLRHPMLAERMSGDGRRIGVRRPCLRRDAPPHERHRRRARRKLRPAARALRAGAHAPVPWAPSDEDSWEALRWANGRGPMGERPRLAPDWVAHPGPLDEWDGQDPNV
jgi:hypothetical protein